jgi:hypothetical protein
MTGVIEGLCMFLLAQLAIAVAGIVTGVAIIALSLKLGLHREAMILIAGFVGCFCCCVGLAMRLPWIGVFGVLLVSPIILMIQASVVVILGTLLIWCLCWVRKNIQSSEPTGDGGSSAS